MKLRTRSIAEAALLTGLSVALYLAANFIPVFGFFLVFLCPIPLVILEMRHDLRTGFTALAVGTVLTLLLSGPVSAVSYALGFGVLALALGRIIELKRNAVEIIIWGSLVSLVCKLMLAGVMFAVTGLNPFGLDVEGMEKVADLLLSVRGNSEAMKQQLEMLYKTLPLLVPSIIIMASVMDCFLCYWLSGKVVRRTMREELPELPPFSDWRFPRSVLGAYLVSVVCQILSLYYPHYGVLRRVGINLQLLVQYIFMLQGFSLLAWFLDRKGFSRKLRNTLVIVAFFIPILSQIALYAGIVDMCWDTRSRVARR